LKKVIFLVFGIMLCGSCIDRVDIKIPDNANSQLVVDGIITDAPGPYTVRLSRASRIAEFLNFRKFITVKSVILFDNVGNSELMTEVQTGTYQTKAGGIQGVVGRKYAIKIEMQDGQVYESVPDIMNPVGEVDSLYYKLETFQPISDPTRYGLRVFADSKGLREGANLFRWKFSGTYLIYTFPLLHTKSQDGFSCVPDPRSCGGDGPYGSCTCCTCWVTEYEAEPRISDNQFVSDGVFRNVEIGYVPVEYFSFQNKYRISVELMSLSRTAFDYWKIIQTQKEGASSLFQPPTGKARTNVFEKNGLGEAVGLFYASAIKKKHLYVTRAEVSTQLTAIRIPHWNCEIGLIAEDCRLAFPFSTTTKPVDWE